MTSDLLREAARQMREKADRAAHGPWSTVTHDDGRAWVRIVGGLDHLSLHGYPSTAEHIASWHPAVALAVADWLEDIARWIDFGDSGGARNVAHAIAVARAYLGIKGADA